MASGRTSARHCCVPQCVSDDRYNENVSFHKFPKDKSLRQQWIIKIRRDVGPKFQITDSTVVCSEHFKKDDYKWTPLKKKTLNKGTIPTVFNWTEDRPARRKLQRKELAPVKSMKRWESDVPTTSALDIEDELPTTSTGPDDECVKQIDLEEQLRQSKEECERLKVQIEIERFGINRFSKDDGLVRFYTGFTNYLSFVTFFNCIKPAAQNMLSAYYVGSETLSLAGRKRSMLLIDEFFMFLCRLRAGLLEQDLSVRFNCSISTISRKLVTWVNFLYITLGSIPLWLPRDEIQRLMPDEFKELYPNTRVVIDCTELKMEKPSSLVFNSQSYSTYKGANTVKCLLGVAPHGTITFISSLYTGCMSDVEITKLCGLLDLIEPGDDVMADKGFTIRKLLSEKGATLNIPHFLSSKRQFSIQETEDTENIAKLRIHIERMNRRIKENHLFDAPIPITLFGSINQFWVVACILALFKGPLVESWGAV